MASQLLRDVYVFTYTHIAFLASKYMNPHMLHHVCNEIAVKNDVSKSKDLRVRLKNINNALKIHAQYDYQPIHILLV